MSGQNIYMICANFVIISLYDRFFKRQYYFTQSLVLFVYFIDRCLS